MPQKFNSGYALVVGAGNDLGTTISDAKGLYELLVDPHRCAYDPDHVELLVDSKATRSNIISGMNRLKAKAEQDREAKVLFFFSGHGTAYPLAGIVPFDGKFSGQNLILEDELTDFISSMKANELLILFDCCWAAGVAQLKGDKPVQPSAIPVVIEKALGGASGKMIIASSRSDEMSLILEGSDYSIFTEAILESLAGYAAKKHDGYVRIGDMVSWIGNYVVDETDGLQHPIIHAKHWDANASIAFYAGGETKPKGLPWSRSTPGEALPDVYQGDPTEEPVLFNDPERLHILELLYERIENLRLYELREAQYLSRIDIPLQAVREKKEIEKEIARLRQKLATETNPELVARQDGSTVYVKQKAQKVGGQMVGAEGNVQGGNLSVSQNVDTIEKGGVVTGWKGNTG